MMGLAIGKVKQTAARLALAEEMLKVTMVPTYCAVYVHTFCVITNPHGILHEPRTLLILTVY